MTDLYTYHMDTYPVRRLIVVYGFAHVSTYTSQSNEQKKKCRKYHRNDGIFISGIPRIRHFFVCVSLIHRDDPDMYTILFIRSRINI